MKKENTIKRKKIHLDNTSCIGKNLSGSALILSTLYNSKPLHVSGSLLSEKLGISRVAVWSRINKLRKSGIKITGIRNLGYRLDAESNELNKNLLNMWLNNIRAPQCKLIGYDSIDSTNNEAEKLLSNHTSQKPLVVFANEQTDGKGRLGKNWMSPAIGNIYLTVGVKPNVEILKLRMLTLYLGLKISDMLNAFIGEDKVNIKWPNDIILDGKKIGGILTEAKIDSERINSLLIGIGLNVNNKPTVPKALSKIKISSLSDEINKNISVNEMSARLISTVTNAYASAMESSIDSYVMANWPNYDYLKNKNITVLNGSKKENGKVRGLDSKGNLRITTKNNVEKTFSAGEITINF